MARRAPDRRGRALGAAGAAGGGGGAIAGFPEGIAIPPAPRSYACVVVSNRKVTAVSSDPSGFCGLYEKSTLANASVTLSVPPPAVSPVEMLVTTALVSFRVR